jgi:hypothetical protein
VSDMSGSSASIDWLEISLPKPRIGSAGGVIAGRGATWGIGTATRGIGTATGGIGTTTGGTGMATGGIGTTTGGTGMATGGIGTATGGICAGGAPDGSAQAGVVWMADGGTGAIITMLKGRTGGPANAADATEG